MNLKYLNVDDALTILNEFKTKYCTIYDQITNNWTHHGVIHATATVGTGSITIGWERFEKGRISMYMHCMIPKHEKDVEKCMGIMETLLKQYPKIEVMYDGNYERDYNGGEGIGKVYDPFTHKVKNTFNVKHPLNKIELILCEFRGTTSRWESAAIKSEWFKKNMRSPVDYDFYFQKL